MLRYVTSVLSKYINPIFVETGTYKGDGVETALNMGFSRIISVEVFYDFYKECKDKFASNKKVTILHGDSAIILFDVIKDLDNKITFWLDGHEFPASEEKPLGIKACPIIEELEQISKHHIKNHVIMIDDMSSLPKGGVYKTNLFTRKDIEEAILHINKEYKITYFDRGGTDVLIASV